MSPCGRRVGNYKKYEYHPVECVCTQLTCLRLLSILLDDMKTLMEGKMASNEQHVVHRDGKWIVRKTGSDKATRKFVDRNEAIKEGRRLARKKGTELIIHGRDGRIRALESYDHVP